MTAVDSRIVRAAVLLGLLGLTGLALDGYLPDLQSSPRTPPGAGPVTFVAVLVLFVVSVAIVAIALVAQLRQPRRRRVRPAERPDFGTGARRRLRLRYVVLGLGILALCALALSFVLRPGVGPRPEQAPATSEAADPTGAAAPTSAPPDALPEDGPSYIPYLLVTTGLLVSLFVVGAVVAARRIDNADDDPDASPGDTSEPVPQADHTGALVRAAERGLARMGDPRLEPRAAIIACYAAMERELENSPDAAPQASDTATEVFARALRRGALHSTGGRQLVDLFAEARFSRHRMTEQHRETALRSLQLVLDDLRSSV